MLHAQGENHDDALGTNFTLGEKKAAGKEPSSDDPAVESRFGEEVEDSDVAKDSGNESAETSDSEDKIVNLKDVKNELVGMNVSQAIKKTKIRRFTVIDVQLIAIIYRRASNIIN